MASCLLPPGWCVRVGDAGRPQAGWTRSDSRTARGRRARTNAHARARTRSHARTYARTHLTTRNHAYPCAPNMHAHTLSMHAHYPCTHNVHAHTSHRSRTAALQHGHTRSTLTRTRGPGCRPSGANPSGGPAGPHPVAVHAAASAAPPQTSTAYLRARVTARSRAGVAPGRAGLGE
jgi:hypothetical protein